MASKGRESEKPSTRERITSGATTALNAGRGIFRGALDILGFVSEKTGYDKLVNGAAESFRKYRERTSENEEV